MDIVVGPALAMYGPVPVVSQSFLPYPFIQDYLISLFLLNDRKNGSCAIGGLNESSVSPIAKSPISGRSGLLDYKTHVLSPYARENLDISSRSFDVL
jgi:hypothetical protein